MSVSTRRLRDLVRDAEAKLKLEQPRTVGWTGANHEVVRTRVEYWAQMRLQWDWDHRASGSDRTPGPLVAV